MININYRYLRYSGVTIIEIIVTIFIVGVLTAIAIPSFLKFRYEKVNYAEAVIKLGILKTEATIFAANGNGYPNDEDRNVQPEGLTSFPINPDDDIPFDSLFDYDKTDEFVRIVFLGINGQKETPNGILIGSLGEVIIYGDDRIINVWIKDP